MEFRSSFAKAIGPILIMGACTTASVWIAVQSPWTIRAVLGGCALVFLCVLLSSLRNGFDRAVVLRFDERGIHDRRLHVGVVNWIDIGKIRIPNAGGEVMCIVTKDDSKYLERLRAPKRILLRMSAACWGTPFVITFASLKPGLNEAIAYIKAVHPELVEA